MKSLLTLFTAVLFTLNFSQAQKKCATHDKHLELIESDDEYSRNLRKIEAQTRNFIETQGKFSNQRNVPDVVTIPVVVHVLWKTAQQNISDAQIQSQIDVLNEDFRKLNANVGNTVTDFQDRIADVEIEFCLASVDPDGNPTTGIIRKQTTRNEWGTNDAIKKPKSGGSLAWPRDEYLNIWVGNIQSGVLGTILGYAQFPGGGASTDGIVVAPQFFGSKQKGSGFYLQFPSDLGRTATHEVGHWLNLRHIWGDGNCSADDFVGDTPKSDDSNSGCPVNHKSCNTRDNVQNYMDYTDDNCMTMFTEGQKNRMRAVLNNGGARFALRSSNGCGTLNPTCTGPKAIDVDADETTAEVTFTGAYYGNAYTVEIREPNGAWANAGSTTSNSITLTGLTGCTVYEIQITSDCTDSLGTMATSGIITFTTVGPECSCDPPQNITFSNTTWTQTTIGWEEVQSAVKYQFEGRLRGGLGLVKKTRQITAPANSFRTFSLFPFLTYEVRARSLCGDIGVSDWSGWNAFTLNNSGGKSSGINLEALDIFPSNDEIARVYPNPTSDKISLAYIGEEFENVTVRLIDFMGKTVKLGVVNLQAATSIDLFNVSNVNTGMYLLQLSVDGAEISTQKVLITD